MPPRDIRAYISDIRTAIIEIESAVAGLDYSTYQATRSIRSRVEREFMIVGEAIRQVLDLDESLEDRVTAASAIISFRNHLAHGYFLITSATVWGIIQEHLPKLKVEIETIAAEHGC